MSNISVFEQSLSHLTQSDKSGLLSVQTEHGAFTISIQNGDIMEATRAESRVHVSTLDVLCSSGFLAESVVELLRKTDLSCLETKKILVEKGYTTSELFDRALRGRTLDILFACRDASSANSVSFLEKEFGDVSCDQSGLSVSDVLLDLFQSSEIDELFEEIVGHREDVPLLLKDSERALGENEKLLLPMIAAGASVSELQNGTLLSEFELRKALILLFGSRSIGFSDDVEDEAENSGIFDGLFDDELEAEDTGGHDVTGSGIFDGQGTWSSFDGIDIDAAEDLDFADIEERDAEEFAFPAELEAESNKWAEREQEEQHIGPLALAFRSLNYKLSSPAAVDFSVMAILLFFFVSFGFIFPPLLESWFQALSEFTKSGM